MTRQRPVLFSSLRVGAYFRLPHGDAARKVARDGFVRPRDYQVGIYPGLIDRAGASMFVQPVRFRDLNEHERVNIPVENSRAYKNARRRQLRRWRREERDEQRRRGTQRR